MQFTEILLGEYETSCNMDEQARGISNINIGGWPPIFLSTDFVNWKKNSTVPIMWRRRQSKVYGVRTANNYLVANFF